MNNNYLEIVINYTVTNTRNVTIIKVNKCILITHLPCNYSNLYHTRGFHERNKLNRQVGL